MKKILFLLLVLATFCLSGCSWFDRPANVEILGYATVQNDAGLLFVEVNGTKYAPAFIYTNQTDPRTGKESMRPVEGLRVTCFTMRGSSTVEFIAGEHNKAYLEQYFLENYTLLFFLIVLIAIWSFGMVISQKKAQKKKGF